MIDKQHGTLGAALFCCTLLKVFLYSFTVKPQTWWKMKVYYSSSDSLGLDIVELDIYKHIGIRDVSYFLYLDTLFS